MQYDPIKDRLFGIVSGRPMLQRIFYTVLNAVFLRTWYVKRELKRVLSEDGDRVRKSVLDAGTGFGQYAYWIARCFRRTRILAVDIKADYVDRARDFFAQTSASEQVTFDVEDLTQLRAEGPFDLILSVDVMEHIEDDRAVFANFERVLAPGGVVIVNTPSDLGGSDVSGEGDESFIGEHVRDGYNREELTQKLVDAGLKPVRVIYSYGRWGSVAWRMLVKWPMLILNRSWLFAVVLPVYYVVAFPLGMILNAVDLAVDNKAGTGLVAVARKGTHPS